MFKLKRKLIIVGMLLFGITTFISCEKNKEVENSDSDNTAVISARIIGNEHNDGLDYIFNALKEMDVKNNTELQDTIILMNIVIDSTISYMSNSIYSDDFNAIIFAEIIEVLPFSTIKSINEHSILEYISAEVVLNDNQIGYITELDLIFDDSQFDLDIAVQKILDLDIRIVSNCEAEEAELLLIMTSVAVNSLQYWDKNLLSWITEIAGDSLQLKSDDSDWMWGTLNNMGKSDVVGAGIGVCLGGPAGAAAGACYSSAGRGIVALADRWDLW